MENKSNGALFALKNKPGIDGGPSMIHVKNYFDNPTTLRHPHLLRGRRAMLRKIFGLVKERQHCALVGPRRIGKTSLLNCLPDPSIQEEFQFNGQDFLFMSMDLQFRSMKNEVDFFSFAYETLQKGAMARQFP